MEYKGEGIAALVSLTDDLQNGNVILADAKVKDLLKCLAYYEEFRTVLAHVNRGFDYVAEKKRALQKVGEHNLLHLPKNDAKLVALIANMLLEFDSTAMNIISFSSAYFPSQSIQTSFEAFADNVIEPFKLALVRLVVNGIDDTPAVIERTVDFAPAGLAEQTGYLLVALVGGINGSQLEEDVRAELLLMTEGFAAALDSRDILMIRAVWLGLKRTLSSFKLCQKEIEQTDELLKLYLSVR